MMKKLLLLALTAAFLVLALAGCSGAEKLTEYDFGADKIPTVNAVIGETRKVNGVATGTENGVRYKTYKYQSDTVLEDLREYYLHLDELDWALLEDFNLNDSTGRIYVGNESADAGKIITITISFTQTSYEVKIEKYDGTLTRG